MVLLYAMHVFFSVAMLTNARGQNSPHQYQRLSTIVAVQNAFCTSPKSCNSTLASNSSLVNSTLSQLSIDPPEVKRTECCTPCSCDQDCVKTDSCCPEILHDIAASVSTRSVCRLSQLRERAEAYPNNHHFYHMIQGCSVGYDVLGADDPTRDMCSHPDEFDSVDVKVPVTDITSKAVYINRYCAFCNGIAEENIIYWSIEVKCKNDQIRAASSSTIVHEIESSVGCNLFFKVPILLAKYTLSCGGYISTCNETGMWPAREPEIETACAAYSSPYGRVYRNVFCLLCNTDDEKSNIPCDERHFNPGGSNEEGAMVSFSAVLRFRPPKDNQEAHTDCGVGSFFDKYLVIQSNLSEL